jgi:hypothetical protein
VASFRREFVAARFDCEMSTHICDNFGRQGIAGCWVEPCSGRVYPFEFEAYRRRREAEERPRSGHRTLGPDVDAYVWRRWGTTRSPDVEVLLTLRPETSPRIRCLLAQILRSIRLGHPASEAIRQVSRRFGLRQTQTRACLVQCVGFAMCPRGDTLSRLAERPWLP